MSDKLKDLENEISKTAKNRDDMTRELTALTAKIARQMDEQQAQILAGKDAAKIESDLLASQIRERGITKVLSILAETLVKLAADRDAEVFTRAKIEAGNKKMVVIGMVHNVYKSLDAALASLDALEAMNNEYDNIVNNLGLRDPQLINLVYMTNNFKRGLPQLMQQFPAEIWNEKPALLKA